MTALFFGARFQLGLFTFLLGGQIGCSLFKLFLGLRIALRRFSLDIGNELGVGLIRSGLPVGLGFGLFARITDGIESFGLFLNP